jgi:hypothetical protein
MHEQSGDLEREKMSEERGGASEDNLLFTLVAPESLKEMMSER